MISVRRDFKFGDIFLINFINLTSQEKRMVRRWRNNQNIRQWMYSSCVIKEKEHNSFLKRLKNDNKNLYWIAKNKSGQYFGVVYLNRLDIRNKHAYLGIYTNPYSKVEKKGKMLLESLFYVSFEHMYLRTLKLEVLRNNVNAIRFYTKLGFKKEGMLKEFVFKHDKWQDVFIMGIINNKNILPLQY